MRQIPRLHQFNLNGLLSVEHQTITYTNPKLLATKSEWINSETLQPNTCTKTFFEGTTRSNQVGSGFNVLNKGGLIVPATSSIFVSGYFVRWNLQEKCPANDKFVSSERKIFTLSFGDIFWHLAYPISCQAYSLFFGWENWLADLHFKAKRLLNLNQN